MRLVALCFLGGCFVEATSGAYVAKDDQRTRPTYGFGLAAGLYLDPGPARLSFGGGADFVKRSSKAVDVGGSTYGRLDVNTGQRIGTWWPVRATIAVAGGQGGTAVKGDTGDYELDESGSGWSAFAGLSTGIQAQALGLNLAVGPSVVSTHGDAGSVTAIGPQVRLRLSGVVRGLGTLFGHYKIVHEAPKTHSCTTGESTVCRPTFIGQQCTTTFTTSCN